MELVSIIVPIYNCEKSLYACVDSILMQSYGALDVLLIDDGSNDKSYEICLEYKEKDNRIRVFHHDNHGVSFTRNVGIDNAKGKYIMFVDADDTVLSNMVEKYVSVAEKESAEIVIGGLEFINAGTNVIMNPPDDADCVETIINYIIRDNGNIFGYVPNKIYKTSFLNSNGVRFPIDIPVQEDLLFFLNAVECAEKIVSIFFAGYKYDFSAGNKKADYKLLIANQIQIINVAKQYSNIDLVPAQKRLGNLFTEGLMESKSRLKIDTVKQYSSIKNLSENINVRIMESANSKVIVWLAKHKAILLLYLYLRMKL